MSATVSSGSDTFVQSFARGLSVITTFTAQRPRQTLSQVAQASGLARATVRRLPLTLVDLGYAATDGDAFCLTPRVLKLGYGYLSALELVEIAQPHLDRLSREVGESSSMSVIDGSVIVYVARVPVTRIMGVTITVGPAYRPNARQWAESSLLVAETNAPLPTRRTCSVMATSLSIRGLSPVCVQSRPRSSTPTAPQSPQSRLPRIRSGICATVLHRSSSTRRSASALMYPLLRHPQRR